MKIHNETSLVDFEFWSGAKSFAEKLTESELEQVESILEELYPNGMSATELNDLFWFDDNLVCEWLGLDIDEVYAREV